MSIKSRSTAGTPRFPGSALVEHWAMEGCSRGQPKKLKTWEKEQKEDRRKGAGKSLFLTLSLLSLSLFFCFKFVFKGTILPHFVELHSKRLVINKILPSSSPLRWATKTYLGGGGVCAANGSACPHQWNPPSYNQHLHPVLPPHPPPPPYHESDKRKPRESVSLFPFCLFFFKVRKGLNDLTMG